MREGRAGLPGAARLLAALGVVTVVALAAAGTAMADSAALTVTDSAGRPDPAAQVPRVFTITGNAAVSEYLWASYRPAGGAPCAPSPYSDNASSQVVSQHAVNGTFSFNQVLTIQSAGTYQFCIWLTPSGSTATTPITQVFTFRSPTGTISATLNPLVPRPGQQTQVSVSGSSEAPERVYATVRAAGAPCAPTFDSDTGSSVIDGSSVNGAFTATGTTAQQQPGSYVLCLWLASSSSDAAPIAGPQAIPFTVVQPPPKVTSASVLNCRSGRHVGSVRARFVPSVCLRYRFSVPPLSGQKVTVTFITPARVTYKRVSAVWDQSDPSIIIGALSSRGYKHRRGVWQAVLRVGGKEVNRTSFRVR